MSEEEIPTGPYKSINNFLYPPLPGKFYPSRIRKMGDESRKERYLDVFAASMANHSVALYYCAWTQDEFKAVLDPDFKKRILQAKAEVADRAKFIMHRGMGLVEKDKEVKDMPAVTASMAKVVENLGSEDSLLLGSGEGVKLVVDGLDRTMTSPRPDNS